MTRQQHPYGSGYHVLNTLILWDKRLISDRKDACEKSAIRTDWRSDRRSAYNPRHCAGGLPHCVWNAYKRYRAKSQRHSDKPLTIELVLVFRHLPHREAERLLELLTRTEADALAGHRERGARAACTPLALSAIMGGG